jgi:RimJ/RimL family protein N-acetyltransferase
MMNPFHHLITRNGLEVRIRPLAPTDTAYLVDLYDHLSLESRASRFHPSDVQVDRGTVWEQASHITALPLPDGFGLIAFADLPEEPDAPIGAVRYRLSPPDEAEVSITIRDDMQSQGLGTHLIFLIREYARQHGIRKLFGLTSSRSRFMQQLLKRNDLSLKIVPQGEFTYIAHHIEDI